MLQGDRETMGVYVCASARWWREHGVCKLFASRALVVAFIDGHVHLTGCNNCLTSFHEPLSLPCRCHIDLKKMPGAIIVCDFLSPSQSSLYHHFHSSSHHRLADLKAIHQMFPIKCEVGQNIAMHALSFARIVFLVQLSTCLVHLPFCFSFLFFLNPVPAFQLHQFGLTHFFLWAVGIK